MTSDNPPIELYKALLEAKKDIPSIGKDGSNQAQKFRYRSYEMLVAKIEPILENHGIQIFAHKVSAEYGTEQGPKSIQHICYLSVDYTFVHAESGQSLTQNFCSEGRDYGDKSTTQAYTYARKTMLLQTFGIADEDPDAETVNGEAVTKQAEGLCDRATQRYESSVKAISESSDESAAKESVARYRGWLKSTVQTASEAALSANVSRTIGDSNWSGRAYDYMVELGKSLTARVEGDTT